jgi:E1A/CREB-binding protein
MKSRFCSEGDMCETFPFKTKAIFAFEEIDGTDVVFFGMHVQEYGSECPFPNTRRVYISYLDSVFFFRPKELRTNVYHELLIGYLDYAKRSGYQWAHIWACPPSEGDDYIFHCHPVDQKVPKPKRLQEWYRKMLDKGIIERVVIDYKDIHRDAVENGVKTPTDLPYFEGDFWPNVLEDCIKETEAEEEKKRREEAEHAMAVANEDFSQSIDDEDSAYSSVASTPNAPGQSNGKKKGQPGGGQQQQKKKSIKSKFGSQRKGKKMGSSSCVDLMTKILSTMEKHKEVFFVIRLLDPKQVAQMGPIVDKDPTIICEIMNGRDEFLNFARDKHHEFSSLRRAKYSTMALLYELHTQNSEKFTYTCDKCKSNMEMRYHCLKCDDFDLCTQCYETTGHEHPMEKLLQGAAPSNSNEDKSDADKSALAKTAAANANSGSGGKDAKGQLKPHIEVYLKTFMHAVLCRNANCTFAKCMQFKRVVQHAKQCQRYKSGNCDFCRQLIALCYYHAKTCKDEQCQVIFCSLIKTRLKQQKALNSQAERRRMLMMNQTFRQSAAMNQPSSPPESSSTEQVEQPQQQQQQQQHQQIQQLPPQQLQMNHPQQMLQGEFKIFAFLKRLCKQITTSHLVFHKWYPILKGLY